jgi:xylulokinase
VSSGATGGLSRPDAVALGIDIGSTNIKASMVGIGSEVVELAVCTTPTPRDADELVRAVFDLVRSALISAPGRPEAVGIASMAESGVPLGRDDQPLRPILRWDGNDDTSDLDALVDRLGAAELFAATGVPALPKAPLAQWARLRRVDPAGWQQMRRWAGVADLVGLALTGTLATDQTLAARTMAYRTADAPDRFDETLLAAVGLRPDQLPEVRAAGTPVGQVSASAASHTGLPAGIPVHVAGHDHSVGGWAAGARAPGDTADSIGTAEALVRVLGAAPDAALVRPTGMSITRTVTGDPALMAGSANAGGFVRWWFAHRIGAREAGEVLAEVGALGSRPTGLTVLPYLAGRQTPRPDRRAGVRILDEDGHEIDVTAQAVPLLARAMLEGIALQARWMLEEQTRIAGAPTAPVRILGGPGGGNRPWMDIKARVYPVEARLTTASEPVASGAALLAASRAGLLAGGAPVLAGAALPREPGDPYRKMYERFVKAATSGAHDGEGER